jgi:hypothetical protein
MNGHTTHTTPSGHLVITTTTHPDREGYFEMKVKGDLAKAGIPIVEDIHNGPSCPVIRVSKDISLGRLEVRGRLFGRGFRAVDGVLMTTYECFTFPVSLYMIDEWIAAFDNALASRE